MSKFGEISAIMLTLDCPACEARGEAMGILATGDPSLFCAHGNAWKPVPTVDSPTLDAGQIAIEAVSMAFTLRRGLQAATGELAKLRAINGGLSAEELTRRSRFLVNRAQRRGFGRVECPLCRREKRESGLFNHLVRQHRAEISAMEASAFA